VVLAVAYLASLLFALERLFLWNSSAPGGDAVQLVVDGTAVAAMVAWRLLGSSSPLAGRPLWELARRYAGELAVAGLVISLPRWLPAWGTATALGWVAVLLWRPWWGRRWPRAREHGLIACWAGLLALAAVPAGQTLGLTLAVGSLVVACGRFPSPPAVPERNGAVEVGPPGLGWLTALGACVERHPHRWLAGPLTLAVSLVMARNATAGWLTLTWSIEALVLFGLSVRFRDRPLRIGALAMLGLCLIRLVSVDMRQADLVVRGLVFSGVGLVLVVMNVITTGMEKP
jgi:hypothetical protein